MRDQGLARIHDVGITPFKAMTYHIVSQHEHGGYRCETRLGDLASAISLMLIKTKETRRRHYLVDERGKLIDVAQPI